MLEAFIFDTERQGLSVQTFPIESNLKNINFVQGKPSLESCRNPGSAPMKKQRILGGGAVLKRPETPQSGVRSDLS